MADEKTTTTTTTEKDKNGNVKDQSEKTETKVEQPEGELGKITDPDSPATGGPTRPVTFEDEHMLNDQDVALDAPPLVVGVVAPVSPARLNKQSGWYPQSDMFGGEPARQEPVLYGTNGVPMPRAQAEMPPRESDPAAYAKDVARGFIVEESAEDVLNDPEVDANTQYTGVDSGVDPKDARGDSSKSDSTSGARSRDSRTSRSR